MILSSREKWDQRYRQIQPPGSIAEVLEQNQHLLPEGGVALDLASGLGGNALFLAVKGFETEAWDISSVGLSKLETYAQIQDIELQTKRCDLEKVELPENHFDVIVVSYFLYRPLIPAMINALKKNGLIFYQTFTQDRTEPDASPTNPDYLLKENELLSLFSELVIRVYREEGTQGDVEHGIRNCALLVAQKK